ncbi:hypothetical protein PVAND_008955 [Polypedilum vanderplanki]|uniref:Peptidase S1 domain-containing protein n=1 Tax=Polypedilum vanderplanki TaxID=319348 RepID=A0A9J6CCB6_POLVA|nr:hypothetical protein PVAND_008955 [Polypedilum vanderplanki]
MKLFTLTIYLFLLNFTNLIALQQGERAWLSNARFIASVRLRELEQERLGSGFLCTATLINNWNVLTTATCVAFYLSSQLQVVMGAIDLDSRNRQAISRNIRRMYFHPTFERNSEESEFIGNVAVLQFTTSIREPTSEWSWLFRPNRNLHIQPVRMSTSFPENAPERCAFFAWGQQSEDSPRYRNLLMANLHILDNNPMCRNSSTVFCAGDINKGAALCKNLGGSLICEQKFFGIAITNSCEGPGHFHSIASYRNWIWVAAKGNNLKFSFLLIFLIFINKFL